MGKVRGTTEGFFWGIEKTTAAVFNRVVEDETGRVRMIGRGDVRIKSSDPHAPENTAGGGDNSWESGEYENNYVRYGRK